VRRDKIIGHLQRHGSVTKIVIEGDTEVYIRRVGSRMEYMKQIMIDKGNDI